VADLGAERRAYPIPRLRVIFEIEVAKYQETLDPRRQRYWAGSAPTELDESRG
jgi:hypothetical protein